MTETFLYLIFLLKKGPPDAVRNIFFIFFFLKLGLLSNIEKIEKCSESIGINLHLFFFNSFINILFPKTIDSLLAINKFLVTFDILIVDMKPSFPAIEEIQKSILPFIFLPIYLNH